MEIPFVKYHGAGNDFILLDQRERHFLSRRDEAVVAAMCRRHFGIGADGLILLENDPEGDFAMVYFNADGREGSMCGNGGRCLVAFAHALGVVQERCRFRAVDGWHEARVRPDGWIELRMNDVGEVERQADHFFLDTGSPHYVRFVGDLAALDVGAEGRSVRYNDRFRTEGTNVNFVQTLERGIAVRTYERGVEAETLSCGTGVTACAIAAYLSDPSEKEEVIVPIRAEGGRLEVRFRPSGGRFTDIWLCGPAQRVFDGRWPVG